jgi:hypothetical protein
MHWPQRIVQEPLPFLLFWRTEHVEMRPFCAEWPLKIYVLAFRSRLGRPHRSGDHPTYAEAQGSWSQRIQVVTHIPTVPPSTTHRSV